jgi:hypothetical protein
MSDALSFVELAWQHVELLPARTVMSLFSTGGDAGTPGASGQGIPGSGHNESGSSTNDHVDVESRGFPGFGGSANPGY